MNSKRSIFLKRSVALLILLCAASSRGMANWNGPEDQPVADNTPIRNYGTVWEGRLTRSGMPASDSGWVWLHEQGVKSIVTFRRENDVDYKKFGFTNILRLPMADDPPSDKRAEEFLQFIQQSANQPVHIHCTAGQSRTGMMAALARYAIDGWSLEEALNEARKYRGGRDLSPKRVDFLRRWAATHNPGSARLKDSKSKSAN
jgi:protein tyrosine/serine phosphatase